MNDEIVRVCKTHSCVLYEGTILAFGETKENHEKPQSG
jgi:hypothetical protein